MEGQQLSAWLIKASDCLCRCAAAFVDEGEQGEQQEQQHDTNPNQQQPHTNINDDATSEAALPEAALPEAALPEAEAALSATAEKAASHQTTSRAVASICRALQECFPRHKRGACFMADFNHLATIIRMLVVLTLKVDTPSVLVEICYGMYACIRFAGATEVEVSAAVAVFVGVGGVKHIVELLQLALDWQHSELQQACCGLMLRCPPLHGCQDFCECNGPRVLITALAACMRRKEPLGDGLACALCYAIHRSAMHNNVACGTFSATCLPMLVSLIGVCIQERLERLGSQTACSTQSCAGSPDAQGFVQAEVVHAQVAQAKVDEAHIVFAEVVQAATSTADELAAPAPAAAAAAPELLGLDGSCFNFIADTITAALSALCSLLGCPARHQHVLESFGDVGGVKILLDLLHVRCADESLACTTEICCHALWFAVFKTPSNLDKVARYVHLLQRIRALYHSKADGTWAAVHKLLVEVTRFSQAYKQSYKQQHRHQRTNSNTINSTNANQPTAADKKTCQTRACSQYPCFLQAMHRLGDQGATYCCF